MTPNTARCLAAALLLFWTILTCADAAAGPIPVARLDRTSPVDFEEEILPS